ncbi:ferredoxin [Mycobacterium sp. TNTM28]|uniref:Ferredoxin n=1 Tax=[Mycobacterium] fortunisiensis TaxID=2600579 RepID=A0ABS6KTD5_9MYCO|nr:ferredoxin [[Mycobacterium] fortunisiensis]MBU9766843.1 ferredoxin [[Mycobacterium] fortunisiensis]
MSAVGVEVDAGLCEGHALCIQLAPEVFDLSDDEVAGAAPPPGPWDQHTREAIKSAVDACPRQAISLINTSTKGQ